MKLLKQSTAVVIPFGPFTDATDGVTLETGLVSALDHVSTGIKLSKNGGTLAVRNPGSVGSPSVVTTATTYDGYGIYKVALDATDTGTLGSLRAIYVDSTTCLPVWEDFMVLAANVYDALVGGTDNLKVDAVEFNSDAGAAANAATLAAGILIGTVGPGSTVTQIKLKSLSIRVTDVDQLKGRIVTFPSSASASMKGQCSDITASSAFGSPEEVILTVTQLTSIPVNGDPIVIS